MEGSGSSGGNHQDGGGGGGGGGGTAAAAATIRTEAVGVMPAVGAGVAAYPDALARAVGFDRWCRPTHNASAAAHAAQRRARARGLAVVGRGGKGTVARLVARRRPPAAADERRRARAGIARAAGHHGASGAGAGASVRVGWVRGAVEVPTPAGPPGAGGSCELWRRSCAAQPASLLITSTRRLSAGGGGRPRRRCHARRGREGRHAGRARALLRRAALRGKVSAKVDLDEMGAGDQAQARRAATPTRMLVGAAAAEDAWRHPGRSVGLRLSWRMSTSWRSC